MKHASRCVRQPNISTGMDTSSGMAAAATAFLPAAAGAIALGFAAVL